MSIQSFEDPYPGRCKNIRPSNDGENITNRRCLEMDGHDSKCRFNPLPASPHRIVSSIFSENYPDPKAWVVPE